jgi:hypothetical protein
MEIHPGSVLYQGRGNKMEIKMVPSESIPRSGSEDPEGNLQDDEWRLRAPTPVFVRNRARCDLFNPAQHANTVGFIPCIVSVEPSDARISSWTSFHIPLRSAVDPAAFQQGNAAGADPGIFLPTIAV